MRKNKVRILRVERDNGTVDVPSSSLEVTIQLNVHSIFTLEEISAFMEEEGESTLIRSGVLLVGQNVLERMALKRLVGNIQADVDGDDFVADPLYAYFLNMEATSIKAHPA